MKRPPSWPSSLCGATTLLLLTLFGTAPTTSGQERESPVNPPAPVPATRAAPAKADPAAQGNVRATLSHDFYARSEPQSLFLRVDIEAPAAGERPPRPPLNLALVIDRSGSMAEGGKFEQAARAVALVVENLSESDTVTLVAFNQEAVVLAPAGRAVNKGFLRHRLTEVGPEGWTNLSAGVLEAFAQIDAGAKDQPGTQSKRVIVLTDGLANRGVTDPGRLRGMVEAAKTRGIALSTMGVGADFDPKLLAALAEAGGGRYTYVRAAEDIPKAMEAELSGFLAVTAQNARLEIAVGGGGAITRVFGRPSVPRSDHFAMNLDDLRDGERGSFVLEVAPGAFEKDGAVTAVATLTMDLPGSAERVSRSATATAAYTTDAAKARASKREAVTVRAATLDAIEKAQQAAASLDAARVKEVGDLFAQVHERARRAALETRDQELLNDAFELDHLKEELDAASRAGLLHGHEESLRRLAREADYQRYLMTHHRDKR